MEQSWTVRYIENIQGAILKARSKRIKVGRASLFMLSN
jgi:hypothetical protein